MKQWSRACVLVGCAVLATSILAQQWKADVPEVEKEGVYRIELSAEMVARSGRNLEDLRIIDRSGTVVPFVLDFPEKGSKVEREMPFNILRNERRDRHTVVELQGYEGEIIEAIYLSVRNAWVVKDATITGSDDRENWYALAQQRIQPADGGPEPCGTLCEAILMIPPSDYPYYRIEINDSLTPPIKVESAEWFTTVEVGTGWTPMEGLVWRQEESSGTTRIECFLPYPGRIDRIDMGFEAGGMFHREGRLVVQVARETRHASKGRSERIESVVSRFVIDSRRKNFVELWNEPMDTFTIVVENVDNRPLVFESVRLGQRTVSMLVSLEPSKHYTITTGDPKKQAPQYDLAHFQEQLPAPIATLNHGPLIALPPAAQQGPAIAPSRWWIWAGLVAVLGLVGFMAVRMLREPPTTT